MGGGGGGGNEIFSTPNVMTTFWVVASLAPSMKKLKHAELLWHSTVSHTFSYENALESCLQVEYARVWKCHCKRFHLFPFIEPYNELASLCKALPNSCSLYNLILCLFSFK